MLPTAWLPLLAALLGLLVGSFLNVVIARLPRGESVVRPRSRCPYCAAPLRAVDNVPLLSYLRLGGRCRTCAAPISWRYPAMEALMALLFVAVTLRFDRPGDAIAAAVCCAFLVPLAAIDADHLLLPDALTFPGILVGLLSQPWTSWSRLGDGLVGALAGAGLVILLANGWYWLRHEEGMGLGDVNMLALIGAFLGWKGAALALVLATLVGAASGLTLIALGRLELRSRLPFGVFLALGGLAALFAGPAPVDRYLSLL